MKRGSERRNRNSNQVAREISGCLPPASLKPTSRSQDHCLTVHVLLRAYRQNQRQIFPTEEPGGRVVNRAEIRSARKFVRPDVVAVFEMSKHTSAIPAGVDAVSRATDLAR